MEIVMKQLIMGVLEEYSQGQINLESESARETIADSIIDSIRSKKGWFLDLGIKDNELKQEKKNETN
tara:strand:- start:459 stop:659 length:201 start_codon:yes stop_codon:yes gene_type:complete